MFMVTMKAFIFFLLLGFQGAAAVTHSLKYFYTASSGVPNFPAYVSVGLVDDVQISHCDSIINKNIPKQEWMNHVKEYEPGYWERQSQICAGHQQTFKSSIELLKERFNQTGGVHNWQRMYGCEWDDETGKVKSYDQFGYDGEDFVALDLETETWIAPTPQAVITKHKWENDRGWMAQEKNYFTQECPDWLKKYVNYGRSSLMKTVLPSVSLLQKTPSSPVSCHATGFHPNRAEMVWRKDGEELHEGVEKGEIVPNNDENFQMSVDLDLSSVTPEDWERYDCVFQLSGVNEDIVTKLDKAVIRTNKGKSDEGNSLTTIIPIIVATLVLAVIAVIGFIVYKKRTEKRPPSPVENAEVQEQMIPKA